MNSDNIIVKITKFIEKNFYLLGLIILISCSHQNTPKQFFTNREIASSSNAIDRAVVSINEGSLTSSNAPILASEHPIKRSEDLGLIPEILKLQDGDKIPNSILLEYSSEKIASSIIERIAQQNKEPMNSAIDGFLQTSDVQLFFPEKLLDDVIKEKEILNIHQVPDDHIRATDDGGGVVKYRNDRIQVESVLSGLDLSEPNSTLARKKLNEVRPKSAFLVPKDLPEGLFAFGYGEIVAIPNDKVRQRMTWTPMDSYATPEDLSRGETFFSPKKEAPEAYRYYEAQIWGKFSLSDIDEFWVSPNAKPETLEKLKTLGKPIYRYGVKTMTINKDMKMPIRVFRDMPIFNAPKVKDKSTCKELLKKIMRFF